MNMRKKAAEYRRNARLNPDTDKQMGAGGDASALSDERAVARPQATIYAKKPIRMIIIKA